MPTPDATPIALMEREGTTTQPRRDEKPMAKVIDSQFTPFSLAEENITQLKAINADVTPSMKGMSPSMSHAKKKMASSVFKSELEVTLQDQTFRYMEERSNNDSEVLLNFFRVICLCHDVTKVTDRDGKSFLTGPS